MTLKKFRKALDAAALDILVLPGVLMILTFGYIPMVGIFLAFKKYRPALGIWGSEWCGFENFRAVFTSPDIWVITRNTILYNLAFIFLLMNELTSRKSIKFYQTVAMMPHFLSYVIVAYILYTFLANSYGILNTSVLPKLGIKPISWYSEPKYWPYIIFLVREWKSVGYGSVLYFACISGINPEYYEAAVIDGANRWKQTIHVTLPGILPTIILLLILRIGSMMNVGHEKIILLYNDYTMETADVISSYVYRRGMIKGDYSFSAAVGLFNSVINFAMVVIANRISNKTIGSGIF